MPPDRSPCSATTWQYGRAEPRLCPKDPPHVRLLDHLEELIVDVIGETVTVEAFEFRGENVVTIEDIVAGALVVAGEPEPPGT